MPLRYQICASNFAFVFVISALLLGCGNQQFCPVAGKVIQNGEPLNPRVGYVLFKPDIQKENNTMLEPSGTIDTNGSYEIYTEQQSGAPPGWYKVIVTASGESVKPSPDQSSTRPLSKSLLSAKYGQEKTTPLSIDVVASPSAGAYDLNVSD